jgi:cysteine-rich repeat protein
MILHICDKMSLICAIMFGFLMNVVVHGLVCPPGKYRFDESCQLCPAGSTSAASSNDVTDCSCLKGYVGRLDGLTCHPCESGTFKNSTGPGGCYLCHSGATSPPASTTSTDCSCQVGYEGVGHDQCRLCAAGKYKDSIGNGMCQPCRSTFTTPQPGATSSMNCTCPTNSYKSTRTNDCICKPGAFTYSRSSTCNLCAQGKYKENDGEGQCTTCETLYNTLNRGSNTSSDCVCDAGHFNNEMNRCEECPVKTHNPTVGSHSIESCIDCPYRSFQPTTGQKMCIPLFVDLQSTVQEMGNVVGLFVDGDTSCAYITKTSDSETLTRKICWGSLTEKHKANTELGIPRILSICGDGILNPTSEECDDGNSNSGDGCSDTCKVDAGFFCEAREITADITTSLVTPSTCCRIINGPVEHTPKCKRCGDRVSLMPGTRFQTHDCKLVDVNECMEGTDTCSTQTGGVVCVNYDAVANKGSILFKCECPLGEHMSLGKCIPERFATRFILEIDQGSSIIAAGTASLDSKYTDLKRLVANEATVSTGVTHSEDMVGLQIGRNVDGTQHVVCTISVASWMAMQLLTNRFDTTRLLSTLVQLL